MTRHEIKVTIITLVLIGAAALYLSQRKVVLGNPGLVLETGSLTNELGTNVANKRIALPANVAGYNDELLPITVHEVKVLPKDTTFGRRRYDGPDKSSIQVSGILMGGDRTSIHKPDFCITGQGWNIEKTEVVEIPMASPSPYTLRALLVTAAGPNRPDIKGLYMYWFVSEKQITHDLKNQMWLMGKDLLRTGTMQRWAYISFFSYGPTGTERAVLERMKRLASEIVPRFQIPPGSTPAQTALLEKASQLN